MKKNEIVNTLRIKNFKRNFFKLALIFCIIYTLIISLMCIFIVDTSNLYSKRIEKECIVLENEAKDYSQSIKNEYIVKANKEAKDIISTTAIEANNIKNDIANNCKNQILSGAYCTVAEAGNQGVEGQNAVFAVLNNRIVDPIFNVSSLTEVVERPGQFNVVSRGMYTRISPNKDTWEGIELYYSGIDYSNGAVYFYNPKTSDHIPGGKVVTARINQHVFRK